MREVSSAVGGGGAGAVYVQTRRSFSVISEKDELVVRVSHKECFSVGC